MNKSIVIRGKVFPHTQEVVNSIRTWFTDELILSTWENQHINITGLDKIVLQKDPGPGPVQQSARQYYSYKKGLDETSNELVMVTRSDIAHYEDLFKFYQKLDKYDEKFKIFDDRLVVSNMMTINPEKTHKDVSIEKEKYFRVCDWFQVGKKSDLKKWVNVLDIFYQYQNSDLCTEQLWLCGVIKKNHFPDFDIVNFMKHKNIFWAYLLNNFHIINMKTVGNAINLNWANQPEDLGCYLMQSDYMNKYNQFFNK